MVYNQNIMQELMARQLGQPQPQFAAPQPKPQAAPQGGPQVGNVSHEQAMELFSKMGAGGGGPASTGQAPVPGQAAPFGGQGDRPDYSAVGGANFGSGNFAPGEAPNNPDDMAGNLQRGLLKNKPAVASDDSGPGFFDRILGVGGAAPGNPMDRLGGINRAQAETTDVPQAVTPEDQTYRGIPETSDDEFAMEDAAVVPTAGPEKKSINTQLTQVGGETPAPREFQPSRRGLGGFLGDAMAGAAAGDASVPMAQAFAQGFSGAQKHRKKLDRDERKEFDRQQDRAERRGDKAEARRIRAKREARADEIYRREKRLAPIKEIKDLIEFQRFMDNTTGLTQKQDLKVRMEGAKVAAKAEAEAPGSGPAAMQAYLSNVLERNPGVSSSGISLKPDSRGRYVITNRSQIEQVPKGSKMVVGGEEFIK